MRGVEKCQRSSEVMPLESPHCATAAVARSIGRVRYYYEIIFKNPDLKFILLQLLQREIAISSAILF